MDGRPIPGMYYDKEKKKYFRVQADHVALDTKYAKSHIIREAQQSKRQKLEHRRQTRLAHETIRPAAVSRSSQTIATLYREIAAISRPSRESARSRVFANGLAGSVLMRSEDEEYTYHDFDLIESQGCLIVAGGDDEDTTVRCNAYNVESKPSSIRLFGMPNKAQSLSCSESGAIIIVANSSSRSSNNMYVTMLGDPNDDVRTLAKTRVSDQNSHVTLCRTSPGQYMASGIVVCENDFGRGGSCHLMDLQTCRMLDEHVNDSTAYLALDWLSSTTAILGCRNGRIELWDIRARGRSARLRHRPSAHAVASAGDGHGIWASGMTRASLYDLRMPIVIDKGRQGVYESISTPVVDIPLYDQAAIQMAVWHDVSLVAISKPDAVALYYSRNGSLVRSLPLRIDCGKKNDWTKGEAWISKIRPCRDERGEPKLLFSNADTIYEWSYANDRAHTIGCAQPKSSRSRS